MANINDDTDEELTGPSAAAGPAQPFGPQQVPGPPTNPFQPLSPTSAANEISMTQADLRVLMQRMSEATQAASAAAQAAALASTSQGPRPFGVGDMTKVLPKPDPFRPSTREEEFAQWPQWSWTFEQYLSCLDPNFSSELHEYSRQQTPVTYSLLEDGAKQRSRLLYGMLNGLLYERGRRLLRSIQNQNGFEAWRLLSKDLMPKTRNRVLALLRTINSWPSFDSRQGLAQQLLRLETAFEEYERLEPGGLPENNKMATLLSCLTGQLRQHANVTISDDSSYRDLRELVLRWDGANTKWQSSVASSYGLNDGKKGLTDVGEPVPMDVDRVNAKGNAKGKGNRGKQKGAKGDKGKGGEAKGQRRQGRWWQERQRQRQGRRQRTKARVARATGPPCVDGVTSLATSRGIAISTRPTCKAMRRVPGRCRPVRQQCPKPAQAQLRPSSASALQAQQAKTGRISKSLNCDPGSG